MWANITISCPRWQPAQIDGVFGPQTREAVTAYQRMMGLPETGVADRRTWNELVSTYQSVLAAQPTQEWLEQAVGFPDIFLVEGMRGEEVREAQQLINVIARGNPQVPAVAVDGIFGRRNARRSFGHPVAARPARDRSHRPADMGGHGAARARRACIRADQRRGNIPAMRSERGENT